MSDTIRLQLTVTGLVQGVGFRPFIWRRAHRLGLAGFVANETTGVTIEVEGTRAAVGEFAAGLATESPAPAVVRGVESRELTVRGDAGFAIVAGRATDAAATPVAADLATCAACLADVLDPASRRHGHAFTACTACGPRATIIEALPYERSATTMRDFDMCVACAREYADPADRRFHAEAIACPRCGPVPWLTAAGPDAVLDRAAAGVRGAAAVAAARDLLRRGGILAIKGIGGFHLACDATSAAAVATLRERKHRPGKPLAVMVVDTEAADAIARITAEERLLLQAPDRPIVLVRKREGSGGATQLADAVAPDSDLVGVALPSMPLHHLLCEGLPPLVMTSGNLADEPIAYDDGDAVTRLGGIADAFLLHDRRIVMPCDDSVARHAAGGVVPIRRSRGHAPLPIPLAAAGPPVIAVGGELKAAACLAHGDRGVLGAHVGDVGQLEALDRLGRSVDHLLRLTGVAPAAIAADLHPGYLSTDWARAFAARRGIPLVKVQHHEAHAAALLAEHGLDAGPAPVVVACFDGTGRGHDGTIQGGEFLHAGAGGFRRVAHLAPFPLPGGDAAIRHPWRVALALLHAAGLPWEDRVPAVRTADSGDLRLLGRQLDRGITCVPTTSMGRLFDGVAAVVGACRSITHEAEAAMRLESLAAAAGPHDGPYGFAWSGGAAATPLTIEWRPVIAAVVADAVAGVAATTIAARFHEAVARMIVAVTATLGGRCMVGLTGGVFQNAVLLERTVDLLRADGRVPLVHQRVPPNDGGLALGQVVLARRWLAGDGRR